MLSKLSLNFLPNIVTGKPWNAPNKPKWPKPAPEVREKQETTYLHVGNPLLDQKVTNLLPVLVRKM